MSIEQIVAFAIIFFIGWGVALITRWSKILTFLILSLAGYLLISNSNYKEFLQYHFRHPILYGYLGLAWGYFRNPCLRYRYNFSANSFFFSLLRSVKILLHFFFVKIPVFTIRLIYWLFHIFKTLSSKDGWKNLFWGLWQWLIFLIPDEIKFEWQQTFGRGKTRETGKTNKTYSRTKTDYQESQDQQRTHDRTRTDEAQEERQRREYQRQEQERRQREQQRAEQQAERARQAQEKAHHKAKEQKQKADDRKNAKAYAEAGWDMGDFESENQRFFSKYFEPHVILGTRPDMTKAQKRKKYHQLAKKYMTYCQPYQPIAVQERATEIMKRINQAKEEIIGK